MPEQGPPESRSPYDTALSELDCEVFTEFYFDFLGKTANEKIEFLKGLTLMRQGQRRAFIHSVMAARNLADHFESRPGIDLTHFADAAYTLQVGRRAMEHRRTVVCRDPADTAAVLRGGDPRRVFSRWREEGERPDLSPGVDLSAYRIVQEGLTNALKHAKGAHAEVVVRYIDSSVELEIADDGPGSPSGDGKGHGLVGMRERVAL